jgi:tRNA pseudouridine38-40 synthase
MRYALALEYDGRAFCGFQSQREGCGVQDALERALAAIADAPVQAAAAGRTDAGVHAASQVVHFDTHALRPDSAWVRGVNASLPPAVAVLWAAPVDSGFHARYAATARHYVYLLQNRAERPALLAGRVGWYHRPLDLSAMQLAAERLVGTHDFSAFRAAECQAKSPVKTLARAQVRRDGTLIRFEFSANAFLHHMVRNLVGALVEIGSGRREAAWIGELLDARDRTRGAATFAADGLYFCGADYDARFGLPPTRRDVTLAA